MKVKILNANRHSYIGKIGTIVRTMKANKYESKALVVFVPGFYESAIVTEYKIIK